MDRIEDSARRRIDGAANQQREAISAVRRGRPMDAEFESERVVSRMQFFNVAVWHDGDDLSALAMIADQTESLTGLPESAEAIDDDEGVQEARQQVGICVRGG